MCRGTRDQLRVFSLEQYSLLAGIRDVDAARISVWWWQHEECKCSQGAQGLAEEVEKERMRDVKRWTGGVGKLGFRRKLLAVSLESVRAQKTPNQVLLVALSLSASSIVS